MIQSPLRRRRLVPSPPPPLPPVVLALALATTLVISLQTGAHAIKLTTTSPGLKNSELQNFVARPIHWPEIVLSSNRVEVRKKDTKQQQQQQQQQPPPPGAALASFFFPRKEAEEETDSSSSPATTADAAREALAVGDTVVEYFALNQFEVEWTCTQNDPGRLVVVSPNGVPGIASDCVMDFEFVDNNNGGGENTNEGGDGWAVKLTMEYTPQSPLAVLATPALVADNWLALNVLLPSATDAAPLDSFRKLVGALYGVAGLAHLADLLAGGSRLFTEVAGIPSFRELDPSGQLYALFWCAAGPIAYLLSAAGSSPAAGGPGESGGGVSALTKADAGLVLYGITEVVGAVFASGVPGAAPGVVTNAVGVQAVVLAAWVYSYQKEQQQRMRQQ